MTGVAVERSAIGRALWIAVPVVVLLAAASSPAIAQQVPRFFFPSLAALGGALLGWSLVRSLVRLARAPAPARRTRFIPVVVRGAAALFLLILPLARLVYALLPSTGREPKILAGFGDWRGSEGYPRLSAHRGLDVAGRPWMDVLAASGGRVTVAGDSHDLCGLIVVVDHKPHGFRTIYCHLPTLSVTPGQTVARGQRLGTLGTSGQRAWPGYEHVHLELQRGNDPSDLHDPVARMAGCFEEGRPYPTDRLVLTYPVRC